MIVVARLGSLETAAESTSQMQESTKIRGNYQGTSAVTISFPQPVSGGAGEQTLQTRQRSIGKLSASDCLNVAEPRRALTSSYRKPALQQLSFSSTSPQRMQWHPGERV